VTALCPGSTESGFQAAAIEGKMPLKARKKPSARQVAEYGYRAMIQGKTVAIHGLKNTMIATSIRFFPRFLVTATARKIQEKKH
jgi:short-subunit dehydrogenase